MSVLVYGGSGALGRQIISSFSAINWKTTSIDLRANDKATNNIILSGDDTFKGHEQKILSELKDKKFDAIICVAGGWAGGSPSSSNFIETVDLMYKQSVQPSCISAKLFQSHLKNKNVDGTGLLVLTGAKAALEGTPGMVGYGMAKAAVIHLTKSLVKDKENKGKVVCLLPITLDTEPNRKAMPNADFSKWTKLSDLSDQVVKWASDVDKVQSGLYEVVTEKHETKYNLLKD